MTTEELLKYRKDTPGSIQRIHLNNAGASLMPKPVLEAVRAHLSLENQIGGYEAAAMQKQQLDAFYTELGKLLHCPAKNIAHATSSTDAYNRALSSIPFEKGDVILTTFDDYASNQIAFLYLQKRFQAKIVYCSLSANGGMSLEDLESKLKKCQPKLLAVTHVPTSSGLIQDVEGAGRLVKDMDTWYLVDACQSAGQMPLDVTKIGCDFLTATFRKFMRGPRGVGFLYASDRVLDENLEPIFPDLHGATWTSDEGYTLKPDATRFELWERSWALVAGAREATAYANKIGLDKIRSRVNYLAEKLRGLLAEVPQVRLLDEGGQKAGIVTMAIEKEISPEKLIADLRAKRINASINYLPYARFDLQRKHTEWALRFSPHYYNTEAELENAVRGLSENS